MIKLSDLDLTQIEKITIWTGSHAALTIFLIIFGVLIGVVGFLVFMFTNVSNKTGLWVGLGLMVLSVVLSVSATSISAFLYPPEKVQQQNNNATLTEKIQVWAEENYIVELSDHDAKILYSGRRDYDKETSAQSQKTGAIVDYYNKSTVINLVRINGDWKLFSNDVELLKAERVTK